MGDALEGDFRKAMRTLASAVSIVSTISDNRRFGMTATAVCSLSMQPPTLLVCINQSSSLHLPLLSAGRFCINILHAEQDELARTFSRRDVGDRFAHGKWKVDDSGVPYIADAQASIFCVVEETYRHRTHSIVAGAAYRVAVRDSVHPLLYQDGRYTVGLAEGREWVIPIGR
jgi:flavin reductase